MDFLTNGFHQLYSELESDFTNWEYIETRSSEQTASKIDCIYSSDYYDFVNDEGSFELNAVLESDSVTTFDHLKSEFEHQLDYLPSSKQETGEGESQFLDDYIGLPELTNFLSERTPFCNDSCNVFIKESSDNLKKYHAINETTPILLEPKAIEDFEGDKIFPCTYANCSKVYAKPAHLKAHLRRHLGDKPYVCNWPNCTWKFSRSDELARHKRSHSGIKPYKCTYCVKCFARSDHLSKHLKVHERKMATNKLKGILTNSHHVKSGRRPKNAKGFDVI